MKFTAIATSALLVALAAATETSYDEELGCWPISVEHDATYCIDGPICSGSGAQPAGWKCPVAGDVAIADCHSYLVSYTGGDDCVLPVDTTCQVIKTGAWGCVLTGSTPSPTSTGGGATPAPTSVGGGGSTPTSNPSTPTSNPTTPTTSPKTPTPTPTHGPSPSGSGSGDVEPGSGESDEDISFSSVMTASSAGSVSAGAIAAIAAAAAAVCAAVGTVLYKKYHQTTPAQDTHNTMLEVVTP